MGAESVSDGPPISQRASFRTFLDPEIPPGKFRKAIATASLGQIRLSLPRVPTTAVPLGAQLWRIEDAQATYADEEGKVQLTVDLSVEVQGAQVRAGIGSIMFQVTTLARV